MPLATFTIDIDTTDEDTRFPGGLAPAPAPMRDEALQRADELTTRQRAMPAADRYAACRADRDRRLASLGELAAEAARTADAPDGSAAAHYRQSGEQALVVYERLAAAVHTLDDGDPGSTMFALLNPCESLRAAVRDDTSQRGAGRRWAIWQVERMLGAR